MSHVYLQHMQCEGCVFSSRLGRGQPSNKEFTWAEENDFRAQALAEGWLEFGGKWFCSWSCVVKPFKRKPIKKKYHGTVEISGAE